MTDHTLKNGRTFFAITGGSYGGWAKARDPITAIKDAVSNSGFQAPKNGVAVMVMYGPSETLKCKGRTIKPMKKGDMNADHPDHEEWMDQTASDIEEDVAYWIEKNENAA